MDEIIERLGYMEEAIEKLEGLKQRVNSVHPDWYGEKESKVKEDKKEVVKEWANDMECERGQRRGNRGGGADARRR